MVNHTSRYQVALPNSAGFPIALSGRPAWMLDRLTEAGALGVTAAEHPGARLSAYVHKLRALGVQIDTDHVSNTGEFGGSHAVYRLACLVRRVTA